MTFDVILTGTGYPRPFPGTAGPGTLVIAGDKKLQFDCGRGTTMRLSELDLLPQDLDALFFTHYHSDHMTDICDVLMSRWILWAESEPLRIVGPKGFGDSLKLLHQALEPDVARRKAHSGKGEGLELRFEEFARGGEGDLVEVYNEDGVRVLAGAVDHGNVVHAVGYRVEYEGRVLAISGDCTYCEGLIELAKGADVLVHEVLDVEMMVERGGSRHAYIIDYHSTPEQVAQMATKAEAKKLVLTHIMPPLRDDADAEELASHVVAGGYEGELIVGRDLTRVAV